MLVAFLLMAAAPDWVPARWQSSDPKSLELVAQTPINCLLLEPSNWAAAFNKRAADRGIATFGVLRPAADAVEQARQAVSLGMTGVVLEGDFDPKVRTALGDSKIVTLDLPSRSRMRLGDQGAPVIGTYQGVWPGLEIETGGAAKSAPSGAPWINTNTGFLRFVRAYTTKPVWIANTPPRKMVLPVQRYLQSIADAEIAGAHWVLALDEDFNRRLLEGDPKALADWKRIAGELKFYQSHKDWRALRPHSNMALVEDAASGALLSGGVLDMIAVKHTPVRAVPNPLLSDQAMQAAKLAVDVDPASLDAAQKQVLRNFTRAGGTLLSGPPGWKFPMPKDGDITLAKDDFAKLDEIWKEVNGMIDHKNLGARLFNVSSMLSNLLESADGRQLILHLVNYTDFPIESITAHVLGTFKHARLLGPDGASKELPVYAVEEGTGVDIDKVDVIATVVLD
ncbi:MAG TPA: hypothetical protein VGP62_13550 [Bryobacteraceae bacterium]|jgi:hypothetical protein|nr:hypothetical protein [Bryobacteraceae bacterium]